MKNFFHITTLQEFAWKHFRMIMFYSLLVLLLTPSRLLLSQNQHIKSKNGKPKHRVYCYASKKDTMVRIPAPKKFLENRKRGITDDKCEIIVEYEDFSYDAQQAFQYAVDIWESILISPVPIRIYASWESLSSDDGGTVLGSASPYNYYKNFDGAPVKDKYYPTVLAEKLHGGQLNYSENPDIYAYFNSDLDYWYKDTDGETPSGKMDLVSVVLHEIGHGLGFVGMGYATDAELGTWSKDYFPTIFDSHMINGDNEYLADTTIFSYPSSALFNEYISGDLYYESPSAYVVDNRNAVLYAPSTYNSGSSIYHLDEDTYPAGNANELMTYALSTGQSVHSPGDVMLGMFSDMGWIHTYIEHDKITDSEDISSPITITAVIESDTTFNENSITLFYSYDGFETQQEVSMSSTETDSEYSYTIPAPNEEVTVSYYISVDDNMDRTYTYPGYPPDEYYSFHLGTDQTAPTITHTAIEFVSASADSLEITAEISDNIELDTVYVEYSINDVEQESFGLENDSASEYSGHFIFSDISAEDSIKYKIIAIDASSRSNKTEDPEDGYYKFSVSSAQIQYTSSLESAEDDFSGDDFEIITESGFSDAALHSPHPYVEAGEGSEFDYIVQLKVPIVLNEDEAYMRFDEIVLVENGEARTSYGDDEFYDYVIVEGSNDGGKTWHAFEDGYDCRASTDWYEAYTESVENQVSSAEGTSDMFENHQINLYGEDNYFSGGDEVLIRFRLYSDPYAVGWGWAIDNINIQGEGSAIEDYSLRDRNVKVFPNPSSGQFYVNINFESSFSNVQIKVLDIFGKQIITESAGANSNTFSQDIDLSNYANGIYIVNVWVDNEQFTKKVLLTK